MRYDAGLLNDFGGGDVGWWQDYLRVELERSHDFYIDRIEALEAENAALREAQTKYRKAMDDIYNHNEAARAAVVMHFGLWHSPPTTDKGE